ncbi:hypothetical protein CAP35_11760 [Chitinophagaceae bacterium IBVUCB1]|nr:hypothetical protein CAP35_11760 [Chitinophagaceae bacterium IBVUCB1]
MTNANTKAATIHGDMKRNRLVLVSHIIIWLVFLSIPGFFRPAGPEGSHGTDIIDDIFIPHRIINGLYLVFVFYTNYYIAIPKLYEGRRYMAYGLYILGIVAGLIIINFSIIQYGYAKMPPDSLFVYLGPSHNLLMFIITFIFSLVMSLYNELRKAKEEKLNTEIAFLKAQINPHFLFNTLNSIYSLALTKSDKAAPAVVKLSSLMRYSISDSDKVKVPLSKELAYITNYIELQKLRLSSKVRLQYNVSGGGVLKEIAPFLLIPFVENAFKHGVNAEEDSVIDIAISIADDKLLMQTTNNKVYVQQDEEARTGLGINNTKQRLKLLYRDKHKLVIDNGDDCFKVQLEIYW